MFYTAWKMRLSTADCILDCTAKVMPTLLVTFECVGKIQ